MTDPTSWPQHTPTETALARGSLGAVHHISIRALQPQAPAIVLGEVEGLGRRTSRALCGARPSPESRPGAFASHRSSLGTRGKNSSPTQHAIPATFWCAHLWGQKHVAAPPPMRPHVDVSSNLLWCLVPVRRWVRLVVSGSDGAASGSLGVRRNRWWKHSAAGGTLQVLSRTDLPRLGWLIDWGG